VQRLSVSHCENSGAEIPVINNTTFRMRMA
jgi:hypothetical protein